MSTDFKKVLVKDSRIVNLTDSIAYGVFKGGQQATAASFNAISASTSSHVRTTSKLLAKRPSSIVG